MHHEHHHGHHQLTEQRRLAAQRWLAAQWPFVRSHLPALPTRLLEIGCGPLGGFVPAARACGYAAEGVDPEAPDEPGYHRIEFENHRPPAAVEAVVACLSLHHVANLDDVLDRILATLAPTGVLIVVEWALERFDEPTARWCFDRLPSTGAAYVHDAAQTRAAAHADADASGEEAEGGWLHHHRARWLASGTSWEEYVASWARQEGLHAGGDVVAGLDARFHRRLCTVGPYYFADLGITEAQEQAAIDSGAIQANGIRYVGHPR
jgi:SAM-dependent methyltransferase